MDSLLSWTCAPARRWYSIHGWFGSPLTLLVMTETVKAFSFPSLICARLTQRTEYPVSTRLVGGLNPSAGASEHSVVVTRDPSKFQSRDRTPLLALLFLTTARKESLPPCSLIPPFHSHEKEKASRDYPKTIKIPPPGHPRGAGGD